MKQTHDIGRFSFEECFVFPYEVTKFIRDITWELGIDRRKMLHVCCGKSEIGGLRVDMNPSVKPDLVARYQDLPNILGKESQESLLADPPWVMPYGETRRFSYTMRDLVKSGGYLIINAPFDCWCKGLQFVKIFKVRQKFNSYRHLVDFWIFKKI